MPRTRVPCTPTKRSLIVHIRDRDFLPNGRPKPWDAIGQEVGVDASTAYRNYAKMKILRNPYFNNLKGRVGRKRRWTGEEAKTMQATIEQVLDSGEAKDGADVQRLVCPDVPKSTVRRYLREMGLRGYERWKKPALSPVHVMKRLAFEYYMRNNVPNPRIIIFSDEKRFENQPDGPWRYCRRRRGEALLPRNVKMRRRHLGGIMVWGCLTSKGPGRLIRIDNIMNSERYIRILEDGFLGTLADYGLDRASVIFQQDNDSKHTSHVVQDWLHDEHIIVLPWPPNSPDLSIIENLWDWIDKAVRSRTPVPYTKDEWWKAVQEEWKRIPQHYIDSLYDSIPRRLAAVCEAQGYYTKY